MIYLCSGYLQIPSLFVNQYDFCLSSSTPHHLFQLMMNYKIPQWTAVSCLFTVLDTRCVQQCLFCNSKCSPQLLNQNFRDHFFQFLGVFEHYIHVVTTQNLCHLGLHIKRKKEVVKNEDMLLVNIW